MLSGYILIGADVVPTKSNIDFFRKGDTVELVGAELSEILAKADYRVFNLEVPLCDKKAPITKLGPHLCASVEAVNGYKSLGSDLLTLSNNHILDQGAEGLTSTIETLDAANIAYVGAGADLMEASKPYIFEFASKKIGVYACAEHEFSIATETSAGANPFDPLYSPDHVEELKRKTDFVIVLYHGGKEHYRYPSPNLRRVCRKMIEKGADLIVCQHSHCIGCEEKYRGGTIVYGQGNFIFDDSNRDCWKTSLLIQLDSNFEVTYLPIVKKDGGVRIANNSESIEILDDFKARSSEIEIPGAVDKHYTEFAESFLSNYLRVLSGKRSTLFRIINKLSGGRLMQYYLNKTYKASNMVSISNYIECEAHRELLLQGLSNHYKNIK